MTNTEIIAAMATENVELKEQIKLARGSEKYWREMYQKQKEASEKERSGINDLTSGFGLLGNSSFTDGGALG